MFILRFIRRLIYLAIFSGVVYVGSNYVKIEGTPIRKWADDFFHSQAWIEGSKDLRTWVGALLKLAGEKVQEGITPNDEAALRNVIATDVQKQLSGGLDTGALEKLMQPPAAPSGVGSTPRAVTPHANCDARWTRHHTGTFVPAIGGFLVRLKDRHSRSRGQSLAEFAIVFPVLMLIIGGIIQFGIIFWGQNTLNQVARDTGRWAASQQACDGTTADAVRATARTIASQSSLIGPAVLDADIDVTWSGATPCPPANNQQTAWVQITIRHAVPVFFPFVPGNGHISTSTEFRMEPTP